MANLSSEISIKIELRPCIVKGRKALFHKWSDKSNIVPPSPMIGGHDGGVLKLTVGIIEYEDGVITECYPYEIRFVDAKFTEYCFKE
jgi:hypothetical protein